MHTCALLARRIVEDTRAEFGDENLDSRFCVLRWCESWLRSNGVREEAYHRIMADITGGSRMLVEGSGHSILIPIVSWIGTVSDDAEDINTGMSSSNSSTIPAAGSVSQGNGSGPQSDGFVPGVHGSVPSLVPDIRRRGQYCVKLQVPSFCHACGADKHVIGLRHMKACSACRTARYCGLDCQLRHWAKHTQQCSLYKYAIGLLLDELTETEPTLPARGTYVEVWPPSGTAEDYR